MPNYPQCIVTFANVEQYESCTATISHGITPSQIIMRIAPQKSVRTKGTLVIRYGGVKIVWPDCLADSSTFVTDASGQIVQIKIIDKRWKWADLTISGQYNLRTANGKILKDKKKNASAQGNAIVDCERTPQQLATLCLKALGEKDFDVSQMPNKARPLCQWEGAKPAQELSNIAEAVGCRVVMQPSGKVSILPTGKGRQLPGGAIESSCVALDPPNVPSALVILCGPTRFQDDFEIEGVGLDVDGEVRGINELSYKPTIGGKKTWFGVELQKMTDISDAGQRKLAVRSVGRWFRFVIPTSKPAGYPDVVTHFRQLLPMGATMVKQHTVLGVEVDKPAFVYGKWDAHGLVTTPSQQKTTLDQDVKDTDPSIVTAGLSIDSSDGIFKFNHVIRQLVNSRNCVAGDQDSKLKARIAVTVRDTETGGYVRYQRERKLSGDASMPKRYVKHDEIRLAFIGDKATNQKEVDDECDYYLDALEKDYKVDKAEVARYLEIVECGLDGAIQSITWTVDENGGTTTISRNDDNGSPTTIPYRLRRNNEKNKQAQALAGQTANYNPPDRTYTI